MKVVDKELLTKNDLVSYMKTEKNIMLKIEHPFIVNLKHSFQTPDKFFLLMEYWWGGDLAAKIAKEGWFDEKLARIYIAEITLALEELHRNNIAYR